MLSNLMVSTLDALSDAVHIDRLDYIMTYYVGC